MRRQQGDTRIVAAVLSALFDVLAGGAFVHTTDAHDCKYCEFPRACGRDPVARAAVKVEHESNAALAPYRRLSERE